MISFLSAEWFAGARAKCAGARASSGASACLQFDVDGERSHLVIDDGRVLQWDLGAHPDATVEIRWSRTTAQAILSRTLRGDEALAATTVAEPGRVGPAAPLGLSGPELDALPSILGATFVAEHRYRHGPFGDVTHVLRFTEGRVVEDRLGPADDRDVFVDLSYRAMALGRTGEIGLIDTIEGGIVSGGIGALGMYAGILESVEFRAAELATGRHALVLATLGELDADPVFAAGMQELAAATGPP